MRRVEIRPRAMYGHVRVRTHIRIPPQRHRALAMRGFIDCALRTNHPDRGNKVSIVLRRIPETL
jgi:hypothetical protein